MIQVLPLKFATRTKVNTRIQLGVRIQIRCPHSITLSSQDPAPFAGSKDLNLRLSPSFLQ
jgi:hypothetical protein